MNCDFCVGRVERALAGGDGQRSGRNGSHRRHPMFRVSVGLASVEAAVPYTKATIELEQKLCVLAPVGLLT